MIRAPREAGNYLGRDLDCQEAVEPQFLKFAFGRTAFIDVARMKKAVVPRAVKRGWSEAEVDAALIELGRCYARRVRTVTAAADSGKLATYLIHERETAFS